MTSNDKDFEPSVRDRRRSSPLARVTAGGLMATTLSVPLCLGAARAGGVQAGPEAIEGVRTTLQELVETRRLISAEERDWELGRQTLEDRIALVQTEIDELRQGIEDARTSIGEANSKHAELAAESARLDGALGRLERLVGDLEERARALLPTLPEPLRQRVRPISQALPRAAAGDAAEEQAQERSLGERFLTVVGVLNEVDKFHREVSVASEVRELQGVGSAEVSVLYLGLSQAWFANGDGSVAGVGHSTPEGWVWERNEAAAQAIVQALAIFQNEDVASFVSLPTRIDRGTR